MRPIPRYPSMEVLQRVDPRGVAIIHGLQHCVRCRILVGPGRLEPALQGGLCSRCSAELAREERRN